MSSFDKEYKLFTVAGKLSTIIRRDNDGLVEKITHFRSNLNSQFPLFERIRIGSILHEKEYTVSGEIFSIGMHDIVSVTTTEINCSKGIRRRYFIGTDKICKILNCIDLRNEGPTTTYYQNGAKKMEVSIIDKKLHGPAIEYYDCGSIKSKYSYFEGKTNGPFEEYYEDGKVKILCTTKNGIAEGIVRHFYRNGNLMKHTEFSNGKKVGPWFYYNEDGTHNYYEYYINGNNMGTFDINDVTQLMIKKRFLDQEDEERKQKRPKLDLNEDSY